MGPPEAATARSPVRLQELADSIRLCLKVQVAQSGPGRPRVGPLRMTRDTQRWVRDGAAEAVEPGELR
eukprot:7462626-Alexandrium_andersonii.AAC.1